LADYTFPIAQERFNVSLRQHNIAQGELITDWKSHGIKIPEDFITGA
jgi:hypothetical protein